MGLPLVGPPARGGPALSLSPGPFLLLQFTPSLLSSWVPFSVGWTLSESLQMSLCHVLQSFSTGRMVEWLTAWALP